MLAIGIESAISILGMIISYSMCSMPLLWIAIGLHYAIMGKKDRSFLVPIVFALFAPMSVALPHIVIYLGNSFLPDNIQKILMPRGFVQSLITAEIIGVFILVLAVTAYIGFYRNFKNKGYFQD